MKSADNAIADRYKPILAELEEILRSEKDTTSIFKAVCNLLHHSIPHYTWVGIYILEDKTLRLKAYNGPAATEHTEIQIGRGVCGEAAKTGRTERVPDVSKDPRYLQCFLSTKSEIVVPIKDSRHVYGEIDIDSDELDSFSSADEIFLESVAQRLVPTARS